MRAALALRDPLRRAEALAAALARWASEAPATLLPQLRSLDRPDRTAILGDAVEALTRRDPIEARAWLDAAFPDGAPAGLLERHYHAWPEEAAPLLRERAAALPAGREKDDALLSAVVSWARTEPATAWHWFAGLSGSGSSGMLMEIERRTWIPLAEASPVDALALLREAAAARARDSVWDLAAQAALRGLVERGGRVEDALRWADANMPDDAAWERAVLEILGAGLRRDPERTAQLVRQIGDRDWLATLRVRR